MDGEDLRALHEHQFQLTVFADAKAGALLVLFTGVLGALATSYGTEIVPKISNSWLWPAFLPIAAASSLLFSIALLAIALAPKGKPVASHPNRLYFRHIASFEHASAFADELTSLSAADAAKEWAKNTHALARVARDKFRLVSWGLYTGFIGAILAVAAVVFTPTGGGELLLRIST